MKRSVTITMARAVVLESLRSRFPLLLFSMVGVGVVMALFAGSLAITDADAVRLLLLGASLRMGSVVVLLLFVLSCQTRELNDRSMAFILSLPVSRSRYYFGRLAGYALVALAISLLSMLAIVPFMAEGLKSMHASALHGLGMWGISLFMELVMVAALALFSHLTLRQIPASFAVVMALYLLARVINALRLVIDGPIMMRDTSALLFSHIIEGVAIFLPQLDRFTVSHWLVQAAPLSALSYVLVQSVLMLAIISAAACFDLKRQSL